MPEDNGRSVSRSVSTFENDFREFNGRAPTPEETRKHLAFDRLAKSSSLDPATLLLIVDADGSDRAELFARLDRIEARQKATPEKSAGASLAAGPARDILVFTLALLSCVAVAVLAGTSAPPFVALVAAGALGCAASLAYIWLARKLRH